MTLPGDVIDACKQAELRNEWRLIHYGEPPSFVAQGWSEMHFGEGNGGGSIVLTETEAKKGGPSRHTSSTCGGRRWGCRRIH